MSNTGDSFIDEVAEEVRRDRLFRLMRRYGWIGIAAVVLVVGGAAVTEWRRAEARAAAEALGDGLYAALRSETPEARAAALDGLATGPGAAPALMLEAGALVAAGETEAAAARLQALAEDSGQPRIWRDLAALKRVMLLGRGLAPEERIAALQPLAAPGAPFRVFAVEQEALARLDAGEREPALALLRSLLADQEASLGLRLRAAQLMVALGAEPTPGQG